MADSDAEEFFEIPEHPELVVGGSNNHDERTNAKGSTTTNKLHGNHATTIRSSNGTHSHASQHKAHDTESLSVWGGRTTLPSPMFSRSGYSVWSILKHCIGAELSKITMPVIFNEPLSFLQRVVEYMEYLTLLKRASDSDDPVERHELITAFAVSAAASNWDRIGKPFNPLLGETYELEREDLGFRIVCEQVSHHPPVSAFHVDSPLYTFSGAIYPKLKFWGKSVEVTPKGQVTLYLKRHNEAYSWQNVNCCVHNIIVGKIWIEHYGAMEVTNHKNKFKSVLNFRPCGWFGKDLHKVEGFLYDEQKRKVRAYYGKWIEALFSYDVDVWNEYVRATASQSSSNPSTSAEKPASAREARSSAESALAGSRHLPSSHSEPAMSAVVPGGAGWQPDEAPDDAPTVRGSTCDLNLPTQRLLWVAAPKPANAAQYYSFTSFALLLNELNDAMMHRLPPTDSRFRPDMRRMEEGLIDSSAEEKNRVEEKQRLARKEKKKRKDEPAAMWFEQGINPYTGKEDWLFTNKYWRRDWTHCPDIF